MQINGFLSFFNFWLLCTHIFLTFDGMNQDHHFHLVAQALSYIEQNQSKQPSLDAIAKKMNMSICHFQGIFEEWAGISPENFLEYINVYHAKNLLRNNTSITLNKTDKPALSGTGRVHDIFVGQERKTSEPYKKRVQNIVINYSFLDTRFGEMIVASTLKGICHLKYITNKEDAILTLKNDSLNAEIIQLETEKHLDIKHFMAKSFSKISTIKLDLKGTDFQRKVWDALLKIPEGEVRTYKAIAEYMGSPKASRAVGTAIGSNPIAYLIPCHRVIKTTGVFGGYK